MHNYAYQLIIFCTVEAYYMRFLVFPSVPLTVHLHFWTLEVGKRLKKWLHLK